MIIGSGSAIPQNWQHPFLLQSRLTPFEPGRTRGT